MPAPVGNGYAKGNSGGGAPRGNANAMKHGVYSPPRRLLAHLTGDQLAFVEDLYHGYLSSAGFGEDDPQAEKLKLLCVQILQQHIALSIIQKEGMGTTRTVVTDGGHEIQLRGPNRMFKETHQLSREISDGMRELGLYGGDPPQSGTSGEPRSLSPLSREHEHTNSATKTI